MPAHKINGDSRPVKNLYWHVLLLSSLSFSQPLFKALGSQPEFLLAHSLDGFELLLWISIVGFLPGLVAISLLYVLTRLFRNAEGQIAKGSLFILLTAFFFTLVGRTMGSNYLWPIIVSLLLASVTLRLYGKSIFIRTFFTFAVFMVIVVPVMFAYGTDVRQLLIEPRNPVDVLNSAPANGDPVVIILLDELPVLSLLNSEGNINAQRYPNFAGLANRSTWYKYATTVAEATLISVPAILSGQLTEPSDKKLPLAANYPVNLFTLLSASHEINAFETFTQICPEDLCNSIKPDWRLTLEDTLVVYAHITLPDRLQRKLPPIDTRWSGYLRDEAESRNLHSDRDLHPHHRYKLRLDKFDRFMSELETVKPASLNYLHLMMPHSPWMYLPDGRIYSNTEIRSFTGTLPPGAKGVTQATQLFSQTHLVDHARQRHLLQLGYTDKLLGKVFSLLEDRDIFNDAMIIVMADHGVSFKPGESLREANQSSYQDILSVPLFIKYPRQEQAEIDLRTARTVDVLPTILDALDSRFDHPGFDGQSLLRKDEAELTTLTLQRDTGQMLEFQVADFKDRLDKSIESREGPLVDGSFDQIYALNNAGLLNKAVQQFALGEPVDYSISLDNPHLYTNIKHNQNTIPTLIRASRTAQADPDAKATIAVSINDIIRGVSVLQKIDAVAFDFQVLVPTDSFQDGNNSMRFYQVTMTTDGESLSPIPFESTDQAELITNNDATMSLNLNSQQIPVTHTGDHGEMTIIAKDKTNQIRLTGWAASSDDGRIATEVFFFSAGELIASVRPNSRYPRASEVTGYASAEYSGFNLIMPVGDPEEFRMDSLTATAVFDPGTQVRAGELRYFNRAEHLVTTREFNPKPKPVPLPGDADSKDTIEPGRVYEFSDETQAAFFSGNGWSDAGADGSRWTIGDESTLGFKVKNIEAPLDLVVQITPFFVKDKHEQQSIEASLPSGAMQLINLQRGQTDGRVVIHITPENIGADGTVLIILKFPHAATPKSLGINNDTRLLALKVKTLQVLIAEDTPD